MTMLFCIAESEIKVIHTYIHTNGDVPLRACTVGATTETRRQNTAAQAVVHRGRSVALMNLGSLTFKL